MVPLPSKNLPVSPLSFIPSQVFKFSPLVSLRTFSPFFYFWTLDIVFSVSIAAKNISCSNISLSLLHLFWSICTCFILNFVQCSLVLLSSFISFSTFSIVILFFVFPFFQDFFWIFNYLFSAIFHSAAP